MFERYSDEARRVLFFARDEAASLGSDKIEPQHLLLGLLREGADALAPFLKSRDAALAIRSEIETRRLPRRPPGASLNELGFSQELKRVLAHAAEESWQLDDQNIEPVHLLLGLLRETGSVAAELLRRHGVEIAAVRGEAEDLTPNLGDEDLESEAFSAAVAALPADRRDAAWRILEALGRAQVTVQVTSAEDSFTVSFDTIAPAQ